MMEKWGPQIICIMLEKYEIFFIHPPKENQTQEGKKGKW
jgi:hypothetical protein